MTDAHETVPPAEFKAGLVDALPTLRAFARSLSGDRDRADDLVQETVARAITNREKFRAGTNLHAWLVTILRNQFYSEIRKRKREVEDIDGAHAEREVSVANQQSHLDMGDFLRALHTLPDDQREALLLTGASGFAYEEVAEITGVAVGTVKSRVSRARSRLEELLGSKTGLPGSGAEAASLTEMMRAMNHKPAA